MFWLTLTPVSCVRAFLFPFFCLIQPSPLSSVGLASCTAAEAFFCILVLSLVYSAFGKESIEERSANCVLDLVEGSLVRHASSLIKCVA